MASRSSWEPVRACGPACDRGSAAMNHLRDRLLTKAGARAVTSPSAIVLAGAGAAVGIVTLGPPGAALGAVAYLGRVLLGLPKAPALAGISAKGLDEPWGRYVREALEAQRRFRRAVGGAGGGVIAERMTQVADRVDDAVRECSRIARRGHDLEVALTELQPAYELRRQLSDLRRAAPDSADAVVARSLQAQLESTERIAQVAADARERLRVLDARLDEAVARAIELGLRAGTPTGGDVGGVQARVDEVVADMEALRQALEETARVTS